MTSLSLRHTGCNFRGLWEIMCNCALKQKPCLEQALESGRMIFYYQTSPKANETQGCLKKYLSYYVCTFRTSAHEWSCSLQQQWQFTKESVVIMSPAHFAGGRDQQSPAWASAQRQALPEVPPHRSQAEWGRSVALFPTQITWGLLPLSQN